ncbi:DUF192 domain-containing protein [Halomonas sp. HP20-15]|uniref:DUF192 domain-containing protein n=1 Tax=Halomonas sp. HP20-15 TaxID=3085901 RepID=UPI002980AC67|nr:DUF192 domain-containing protein [Halomonas sp. HP20-15]MDW5377868.1 DUF192 domain-containing protein [Halomonas sp. HP20-15]
MQDGSRQAARHWRWAPLVALGMALSLALAEGDEGGLERSRLIIDNGERRHALSVEIAREPRERSRGLMNRETLPDEAGMLFVYPREQSPQGAFWMHNTLIPLAIAFLGSDGEILAIRHMPPCLSERASDCPSYPAGVAFRAALEVNDGYFAARDIEVGDRVALPVSP